jgi:HKD family nuclease
MASEKITISNFLHEQSILIVGAKDVITDSLIEKILNHCDVWHIYVVFHNPEGNNFSNRVS